MDLVKMLVTQLGVTEDQAKGGTGLLLKAAQDRLDPVDFEKVSEAIPGSTGMMDEAPEAGVGGALMGMLGKAVGGQAGDLAAVVGGFSKLGLKPEMIQKFLPIIMGFIQQKGSPEAAAVLQKAMKP